MSDGQPAGVRCQLVKVGSGHWRVAARQEARGAVCSSTAGLHDSTASRRIYYGNYAMLCYTSKKITITA